MDKTLFSYTRHFFSGTLLSRLSGFFRDVSMAFAFGDIPEIAALILAYRLCMLLRRVLGEGSMQSAFIPGYQTIREASKEQAFGFFKEVLFKWLLGIAVCSAILGFIFMQLTPYFSANWQMVVNLSVKLLPCLVFVIGYTLFQALLQCHGRYFTASFAPSFSNILWGVGCLFSRHLEPSVAMNYVSYFICAGLLMQWLVLLPAVKKILPENFFSLKKQSLSDRSHGFNFLGAVALAAIGVSATQINSALDGIFAKFADPKGPIHLWFSIRIQQLPLALLSIGLVSAATPKLCQLLALQKRDEAKELLESVASKISIMMVFITCGILVVGDEIIRLLFQHGMFSQDAASSTFFCLNAYMIGLAPTSLATVYASFFYAMKDYKKPSIVSVYCLVANLVLNSFFIFGLHMGSWSVAAATSLCSFLNAFLLKRLLKKLDLISAFDKKQTIVNYAVALAACLVTFPIKLFLKSFNPLISLSLVSISYIGFYLLMSRLIKFTQPLELLSSLIPKKRST